MRTIWKGAISFGLVNIPIGLYPATRNTEKISFRQLRDSDLSPIRYKRVAEADNKEVPWEHIVKGYEYEKDQFVVVTDKDFEKVDVKSTQTIDILDFVDLQEIDPIYFDTPYYLAPEKSGRKAYALLRDTLKSTGKIGIAKVVLKTRQHLAAVKPRGNYLVLELMHFPNEIQEPTGLDVPKDQSVGKKELDMAKSLVETMSGKWNPEKYQDDYTQGLIKLLEAKVAKGGRGAAKPTERPRPTNVVDLVSVLQRSISQADKSAKSRQSGRAVKRKRAA
jgi:DNA end-binding protein Ku